MLRRACFLVCLKSTLDEGSTSFHDLTSDQLFKLGFSAVVTKNRFVCVCYQRENATGSSEASSGFGVTDADHPKVPPGRLADGLFTREVLVLASGY